ncbi:hypothetical protein PsYK624_142170 [Phanerochaete sordida]|uniref:Uncharacterized protein n=1 Tax=Phanerochaete sordida TaxID=48140 RepID=A0A9P3GR58_9APHY|nr:hypothetical protein PsYK624_142170 [Phanerochaete sordida]
MRMTPSLTLLTAAAMAALASPVKRQGVPPTTSEDSGIITAPANNTNAPANTTIPFGVQFAPHDKNVCHGAYSSVDIYILAHQPTTADLNSTFGFSDYLHYFGRYIFANEPGLPPIGTPPPSTLTMPDLGAEYNGESVFLAVVEEINDCPPLDYTDYSIDFRALGYFR